MASKVSSAHSHDANGVEANCVVASFVFLAGVVMDALLALDPSASTPAVPTSFRITALILIGALASPPLRETYVFEQRAAVGVALAGVALVGRSEAGEALRFADAMFVALVLFATFGSVHVPGMTGALGASTSTPSATRRESACNLALACLFYVAVRMVRLGFVAPTATRHFYVDFARWDGSVSTLAGPAVYSATGSAALVFGGGVAACVSALLFASVELRTRGTDAKRRLLASASFFLFAAAFVTTLAQSDHHVQLGLVINERACPSETCPAAGVARRRAVVSCSSAALWFVAFGVAAMAFSPELQNGRHTEPTNETAADVVVAGLASLIVCLIACGVYLAFSGPGMFVDIAVVVGILSVGASAFLDRFSGSLLFLLASAINVYGTLLTSHVSELAVFFTHVSLFCSFVLLLVRSALVLVVDFFWWALKPADVEWLDDAIGIATIGGVSITSFLYFASALLIGAYDGALLPQSTYEQPDGRFARTFAAAILEHWIPVLVWVPLFINGVETARLRRSVVQTVFFSAMLFPLVLWAIALAVIDTPPTYSQYSISPTFLLGLVVCVVAPWGSLASL